MHLKTWILMGLGVFWFALPAFGGEKGALPCEVLESSQVHDSSTARLNGIHYIVLRHANSADREMFSKWLKEHSGLEVRFSFNQREYHGVLFRLAHCFGRGLLIHAGDVKTAKRDIIEVFLPQFGQNNRGSQ